MSTPASATRIDLSNLEVLRRGLAAFAELGYDNTTVRELARRVGVNHNFIGDRFGSKLSFWFAVVDFAWAESGLTSIPDGQLTDDELLMAWLRAFYRTTVHSPHLHRLLADEAAHESERLDYLFDRYIEPTLEQIQGPIDRLIAARAIPDMPRNLLFFTFIGPTMAMTHTPLARRLGRPDTPNIAELERYADQLADTVIAGLFGERRP
ncbi:TetR/AcrR family transcriptional regulator [Rhodococcus pyridinivorans]|uniref:TetR/AcrR family transcriptional regulator n=1 Tax=Rhodococcus TaxID=1827 RepID=UPI001C7D6EB1|nr:TetR/AcrR family transcriptional regulator [Rhodococcus sp. DMU2021]MBX4171481.1 TetR/AcrR family transcriptional regulator [Rhodococcus sp. DMU2021]